MEKKILYGLVGRSLGHSFSETIHRALGCADYKLIELEPEELPAFFSRKDIKGLNITIPYKIEAAGFMDSISENARKIGSINTVVRDKNGVLRGYNTDAAGLEYCASRCGISFKGKKTVIFGSGGASLAARAVSEKMGARETVVISRKGKDNYSNLSRHSDAQILINATPVGMYPDTDAYIADPSAFHLCEGVIDMIYNPCRTRFLMLAEEAGIPCTDGLPMLCAQAVFSEELFYGKAIPVHEIERVIGMLRKETSNIVLIGMPGAGKSAVGRKLASITGRKAVDIDEEIVKTEGCTIGSIFRDRGERYFRELESSMIRKYGRESGIIIITGGGAVKDKANKAHLRQNGRVYHIEREISLLDKKGRPLSSGNDLKEMYDERLPLYREFRDAVIYNDDTVAGAADAIWKDFTGYIGDMYL